MRNRPASQISKLALLLVVLGGCGDLPIDSTGDDEPDSIGDDDPGGGGYTSDAGAAGGGYDEGSSGGNGEEWPEIEPGQLTAGEWDDNAYFDFFQASLEKFFSQDSQIASLDISERVVISVFDSEGAPLSNAHVEVFDQGATYLSAPTGSDGRLLYFPGIDGAPADGAPEVRITPLGSPPEVMAAPGGSEWLFQVGDVTSPSPSGLDLAFVIDTTGSMTDELEYVKAEVSAIAGGVQSQASDVSLRYALILYRDDGDEYVVRSFDFTDSLEEMRARLDEQHASGGGDYPEAMDRALAAMTDLEWRRASNTARVAFLIADAPPHDSAAQHFLDVAAGVRATGIRIFPVAASGVADRAEYLMRTAALVSLGRYLFLTDDSGIGNTHAEPHIPCYSVELLRDLMIRTALSELSGQYIPPAEDDILRVVGELDEEGRCILEEE